MQNYVYDGYEVTFDVTEIASPESFSFVLEEESVTAQSYSAEFTLYSDWGTGCNGAIILSNLTKPENLKGNHPFFAQLTFLTGSFAPFGKFLLGNIQSAFS